MKNKIVTYGILFFCNLIPLQAKDYDYPFQDPSLPVEERVEDLISRLTLSEKVQMMKHQSPAVERLGYLPTIGGTRHCTVWHGLRRK